MRELSIACFCPLQPDYKADESVISQFDRDASVHGATSSGVPVFSGGRKGDQGLQAGFAGTDSSGRGERRCPVAAQSVRCSQGHAAPPVDPLAHG